MIRSQFDFLFCISSISCGATKRDLMLLIDSEVIQIIQEDSEDKRKNRLRVGRIPLVFRTVYLPHDHYKILSRMAYESRISKSAILRWMIRREIERRLKPAQ